MKRWGILGAINLKGWLILVILGAIVYIPLRITLTRLKVPNPQGMLILAGDNQRKRVGAELAAANPDLSIWLTVPSGESPSLELYFDPQVIEPTRLHYEPCTTDTVTDFTCSVDDLRRHRIRHVYLVTSDFHIPRAMAIAWWVFGSRGIIVTPYPVPCAGGQCGPPESRWRILRDQVRSVLWLLTGKSGASFNPRLANRPNPLP
ncbi:MAG: YdcF family protein [Synechocystis sp.]|nr:YdcF family protein [Synechocystis sp.]